MTHRVVWRRRVVDTLHTHAFLAYELGNDPTGVTRAIEAIIERLTQNPTVEGESREGNERVLIVHPLSVTYEVFEEAGVVLIYGGVVYPRRRI